MTSRYLRSTTPFLPSSIQTGWYRSNEFSRRRKLGLEIAKGQPPWCIVGTIGSAAVRYSPPERPPQQQGEAGYLSSVAAKAIGMIYAVAVERTRRYL